MIGEVTATGVRRRSVLARAAGVLAAGLPPLAFADDGPVIRLLVGLAPGGSNDIAARALAERLQVSLKRTVVVESRLGAGQRLALGELRRAAPDGNTLMLVTNSPFTIYPNIYAKLDYDPVNDFTPIAGVMSFDMGVAVGPMVNVGSLKEWVAWARAHPDMATYGTPGAGTLPHFLGVAIGQSIGVDLRQVPYRGGTPAMTDLAGGHLPLLINGLSDLIEMHRAGKIRVLAVTGDKRSPQLPEIPTLKESGIDVSSVITVGIFGPARMAPALVESLHRAITEAVQSREIQQRFAGYGLVPAPLGAAELAANFAAERQRLAVLVKASGYVAE
jgi:tripartite-type tricarboxylate transporter receptor subunit TctC